MSDFLDCCASLAELWWTRHGGLAPGALARPRLEALVAHARRLSPFYREHYRGLPERGFALEALPPVDKPRLMSRFDDWSTDRAVRRGDVERFLASRRVGELYLGRYVAWKSSGTSGVHGIFLQDGHALAVYDALVAAQFHALPWTAERIARTSAGAGRSALVAAVGDHFAGVAAWEHQHRAYPGPGARTFSVMAPMAELVRALNEYRPAVLAAYPSALALLAAERIAGRLAIEPAIAWSGGESLPRATRATIEAAFGCPVVNEYGSSESLAIGYECGHGAIHVNADWVILEPVDARGRPSPPGKVSHATLVTNLANWLQPVIRYDLGDRVTPLERPCACGSRLPAIHLEGRRDDVVDLCARDGARVRLPPLALATVLEESSGVHRFQIVQSGSERLAVRIDAAPRERAAAWRRAAPALRDYLGRQGLANVGVSLRRERPRIDGRSGKLRAVVVEDSVE